MTTQRILISGIPGTGKSRFAKWLHDNHGFVHHDVDDLQGVPSTAWLLQQDRLIVDWGFPANEPSLSRATAIIQSWISVGVEHWWFDGDREAALESFLHRNTVSKRAWDIQLKGINQNWPEIAALFPPNRRLSVISPGPAYLSDEEIFRVIFRGKGDY